MDPAIAALFERVCKSRVGDAIPTCLVELSYEEVLRLTEAGLFIEPSTLVKKFNPATSFRGKELWGQSFGRFSIGFSKDVRLPEELKRSSLLADPAPSLPAYALTSAGLAISTILADEEKRTMFRLAEQLKHWMPDAEVMVARRNSSNDWEAIPASDS
jgi:hypothetical protein